jgi:cell division protein FtsW
MARKLKPDKFLYWATLLLVCGGLVMVYSASASLTQERFGQPSLFLVKQAMVMLVGLLVAALLMHVDYRTLQSPVVIWSGLGVVFAALVAVLFGEVRNNTHRWFSIAGITVQPSEFAKLAVIVFTADLLGRRAERSQDLPQVLLPLGAVVGAIVALVVIEPDFGTGIMILATAGLMVYCAGLSYRYLTWLVAVVLPLASAVLYLAPYRRARLLGWLDPWGNAEGSGYHGVQSMIAVGTGGWFGRGLMDGIQKRLYLPEPHSDFIYAVIAEELGLLGAAVTVLAYGVIAWRGLRIASTASDRFGAFLAVGITAAIAVQALVNVSVVLGLLPAKGIPLPFVSAGGSSLIVSLVGMGILLNVSQHASGTA